MMKSQEQYTDSNRASSTHPRDNNFDFSLWSRLVRQQMISSLQKRQNDK